MLEVDFWHPFLKETGESKSCFSDKKIHFQVERNSEQEWGQKKKIKLAEFFSGHFLFWLFLLERDMKVSRYWGPSTEQREKFRGFPESGNPCWNHALLRASSPSYWSTSGQEPSGDLSTCVRSQRKQGNGLPAANGRTCWKDGAAIQRASWRPGFPPGSSPSPVPLCLFALFQL